jgi:toxin ParE1/3/4
MAEYQLSALALSDIKDISAVTIEAWGKKQARFYLEKLHNTLLMLASNPDLGQQRDEIFSGAKSFLSGKHIIFYRSGPRGIEVARVLHQRMDLYHQFGDERI